MMLRRRPRHLPVRHLLELPLAGAAAAARPSAARHRPHRRHHQGLHDAASRRPFPTELTDALGARLRADGRRVRRDHRAPAAVRMVRRVVVPARRPRSPASRLAVTSRRADRHRPAARVHAYELGGRRLELPPATERAWARVVPSTRSCPAGASRSAALRALADCRATRALSRAAGGAGRRAGGAPLDRAQRDQTIRWARYS